MKLILSTLALGAAATSSALDLGGDAPQATSPTQPLAPVAAVQLPHEAPLAVAPPAPVPPAPVLPAAAPAPPAAAQAGVPILSEIPTIGALFQDDDDLQKSAKELEKEIAALRKQLSKMRKELRDDDGGEEARKRAKERAESSREPARVRSREARERGAEARVRREEAVVRREAARARGAEAMARGEAARARGEVTRIRAEAARAEGQQAREEARRRIVELRARADAPRPARQRVRLIEETESEDGEKQVIIMRGGDAPLGLAPGAGGGRVIGIGGGAGGGRVIGIGGGAGAGIGGGKMGGKREVHEIHMIRGDHDAPHAGHGSTININVDEGDVHIHAGGAQIHTSKGANAQKKGDKRTMFGMTTAPEAHEHEHEVHTIVEHLHGDGPHVVDLKGLHVNAPQVLEWTTVAPGEGPHVKTWTSKGDAPNVFKFKKKMKIGDGENVFFFDGDGEEFEFEGDVFEGSTENFFTFDGKDGPSKGRVIIKRGDGEAKTKHFEFPGGHGMVHVEVNVDGEDNEHVQRYEFRVDDEDDGDGEQVQRYQFRVGGEALEIPHGAIGVDGSGIEALVDLQGVMDSVEIQEILGSIDLEGIQVDLSEVNLGEFEIDVITEEIQEALEEAHEAIEEIEIEDDGGRVIRSRVFRTEPVEIYRKETLKGDGGKTKTRVHESANPFETEAGSTRTVGYTRAVNSPFGQPAGDDELMSAVRDIQAQLQAMRTELQELREAVLEAPRRTSRRAGFGGEAR